MKLGDGKELRTEARPKPPTGDNFLPSYDYQKEDSAKAPLMKWETTMEAFMKNNQGIPFSCSIWESGGNADKKSPPLCVGSMVTSAVLKAIKAGGNVVNEVMVLENLPLVDPQKASETHKDKGLEKSSGKGGIDPLTTVSVQSTEKGGEGGAVVSKEPMDNANETSESDVNNKQPATTTTTTTTVPASTLTTPTPVGITVTITLSIKVHPAVLSTSPIDATPTSTGAGLGALNAITSIDTTLPSSSATTAATTAAASGLEKMKRKVTFVVLGRGAIQVTPLPAVLYMYPPPIYVPLFLPFFICTPPLYQSKYYFT